MSNFNLVRRMGGLLMVAVVVCLASSLAAAACRDDDGDTYGRNCAAGPDCNDSNPAIHPGASELCNGVDDNCNAFVDDNTVDTGDYCPTGQPGRCSAGQTQCINALPQCVAQDGPIAETCNGIDDNCNGQVDEGPGADADADGYTTLCDCNDANPAINTAAIDICGDGIDQDCNGNIDNITVDSTGKNYCLEIDPINALAGQPTAVNIRAYYQDGIYSITLTQDREPRQEHLCSGQTNCTFSTSITQVYEGQRYLLTQLNKSPFGFVAEKARSADFICPSEYCPPDPQIDGFMSWMRGKGYAECVASKYLGWSIDGQEKTILKDFLEERPSSITQPLTVDFYDVIPTDSEATYRSVGAGEGGDCQSSSLWPTFCPSPIPADYRFAEQFYEKTFGIDVNFVYHRLEIDYSDNFGTPVLVTGSVNFYRFPGSRFTFTSQFPDHSIVHYSIQTWQNPGDPAPVVTGDMTGGNDLEEISLEPFNAFGAITYTHEWGHTWDIPHSFYTHPSGPRAYIALDGVMDNTYRPWTRVVDPTDPLERYALEPTGSAYLDNSTFASTYNAGIVGTVLLPVCGSVDPAITSGRVVYEDAMNLTFEITLANNGTIPVGYVPLRVTGNAQPGVIFADRMIGMLKPGQSRTHLVTLSKSVFTSVSAVFTLDVGNTIAEANESNNQISVLRCPDADGDGYLSCVDDCNDSSAASHPGAPEVCDGLDNDCDISIDEGFDADQDGWTTCEGDQFDNDPRYNGIEMGGLGWQDISCLDGLDNDLDGVIDCDCADNATGESIVSGTTTGGFASTSCGTNTASETAKEGGSAKTLTMFWTLPIIQGNPPVYVDFRLKAHRLSATGDTFLFSVGQRTATGLCTATTGESYTPAITVSGTSSSDPLQYFTVGYPDPSAVSFCVKVVDISPPGTDHTADSVVIDYMHFFPTILDAKVRAEQPLEGTIFSGNYLSTQSTGSGSETLKEGGAQARLIHTYTLTLPIGSERKLYVEGLRPNNSDNDNFKFSWAVPSDPNNFQPISGVLISSPVLSGILSAPFGPPAGYTGTLYIRVEDTDRTAGNTTLDTVTIDYLGVKTTP